MYKIDIPVSRCIAGMITAEPIIDLSTGQMIIGAEYILTESMIVNLYKFNFDRICVYVSSWNNIWNVSLEVIQKYERHRQKLKKILEHMTLDSILQTKEIKQIAKEIKVDFNANYTILACINMVRLVDEYTYAHSMNVALLAMLIGKWMNYDKEMIEALILTGLVHDVGKERIPKKLFEKPLKLNEKEFEQIKKHILYSYEILEEVKKLHQDIIDGVLLPYENEPAKLSETKLDYVSKLSKVLIIADIYDTMTSHRIYRQNQSPFDIFELMQNGVLGKLDTEVLLTFINNIAHYYVGVYVVLSTGEVGEVVFIHPHCVYRPIIRIGENYIDLYIHHDIKILEIA